MDSTWKLSIRASWRIGSGARAGKLQTVLKLFITPQLRPKVPGARQYVANNLLSEQVRARLVEGDNVGTPASAIVNSRCHCRFAKNSLLHTNEVIAECEPQKQTYTSRSS